MKYRHRSRGKDETKNGVYLTRCKNSFIILVTPSPVEQGKAYKINYLLFPDLIGCWGQISPLKWGVLCCWFLVIFFLLLFYKKCCLLMGWVEVWAFSPEVWEGCLRDPAWICHGYFRTEAEPLPWFKGVCAAIGLRVPLKLIKSGKCGIKVIIRIGGSASPGRAQFLEEEMSPELSCHRELLKMPGFHGKTSLFSYFLHVHILTCN